MIVGPDFIWLHFPKCAGTSIEQALHAIYGGRPGFKFDPVGEGKPEIWHDTIQDRENRDPSFSRGNRRVIVCIRRLPDWILSRVHFEARRPPYHRAKREMMVSGQFYENNGFINHADRYIKDYTWWPVSHWVRTENAAEDLAAALGLRVEKVAAHLPHVNRSEHTDALTQTETERLYKSCPLWTELEARVYGSILT